MLENKTYDTVNVNGATLHGAKVFKTVAKNINRFHVKNIGVISFLFDEETNLTYIWLHVKSKTEDFYDLLRLHIKGSVSEKVVKHYVKSYIVANDIKTVDLDKDTDKWLETIVEYVNYQGNIIVIFADNWFDINLMTLEIENDEDSFLRYGILETYIAGTYFEGDKLIELIGQIDYNLTENKQKYTSKIKDFAYND